MNNRIAFLCMAAVMGAAGLEAQSWDIAWHAMGEGNTIGAEINAYVARGLIPIGIEVAPAPGASTQCIYVLYARNGLTAEQWRLADYRDMETMDADIRRRMAGGWMPRDAAASPSRVYVLFHKVDSALDGYHFVNTTREGLYQDVRDHADQGFYPFGMTFLEGDLWMMFVKVRGYRLDSWQMNALANIQEIRACVGELMPKGFYPNGLTYDAAQRKMLVLFLK